MPGAGGPQRPDTLSSLLARSLGDSSPGPQLLTSADDLVQIEFRRDGETESRRLRASRAERKAKKGNERTEKRKKRRRVRGLGAWRPVVAWPRQGGHGDEVARRGVTVAAGAAHF